jgi:hypothetical protein
VLLDVLDLLPELPLEVGPDVSLLLEPLPDVPDDVPLELPLGLLAVELSGCMSNVPSIVILAVSGLSNCWSTSMLCTVMPVPSTIISALAPTAGETL